MNKKVVISFLAISVLTIGSLTACQTKQSDINASKRNKGTTASISNSEYFYGTLNLSYGDYYYGELNNVEPEKSKDSKVGKYDQENIVTSAGFEDEGMYDAVTSATTTKAKLFKTTVTEDTKSGVNIIGPSMINVAVSKDLYEDVQKAIKNKTPCKNQLVDLVKNMVNVSETKPMEYKVINSDGTISKTIGKVTKADKVTAVMTTTSPWGNYDIMLEGLQVDISKVQGGIIETSDGKKYGLQHLDNLWLQPQEIAFSVKKFVDPRENIAGFKRFEDIQGKTITKITYLIANADDVEVITSLFCKLQLSNEYKADCKESILYNSTATKIPVKFNVPKDSNYELSNIMQGRTSIEKGYYQMKDGAVILASDCKPGEYKIVFTDEKYADLEVSCKVKSGLSSGDVMVADSKLFVKRNSSNLTLQDYLKGITAISINGNPLQGMNLGISVFNKDGSVNFDAKLKSHEGETTVFEGSDSYTLRIKAIGYPSIEMTVKP